MGLPNMPLPASISCVMIVRARVAPGRRTEPVTSLPKSHAAYETVKSFFYTHIY
jgi:hypothetical protein